MAEVNGNYGKPRSFALGLDNLLATILCLVIASRWPGLGSVARWVIAAVVYLLYFLIQEGLWGKTLGKKAFGLVIHRLDGHRAGWRTAVIRTTTRVVEANPLLLGELPGALAVVFSKRKQRLGDMWAGTVVALAKDVDKPKTALPSFKGGTLEPR